jgi:nucleoside-diphosphate-sugar epimerase
MRVLVTGAGGFIGGRVVEVLHESGDVEVRAGVRRWSTAARIGRLPVEIVQCDMMEPDQIRAAVSDVDAIVHCARGPGEITVLGTRNMLEAASGAGVGRFVHISTIDVYGGAEGEIPEDTAYGRTGAEYGDSKIRAEEECWRYSKEGLAISILRPTIVYGPFSALWTEEFAERLQVAPWPFPPEVSQGICNLVYVDDLVAAIRLALTEEGAVGQAFNVNGPERPTWNEYFHALHAAMGLPPIRTQSNMASAFQALYMKPVRAAAKFGLKHFGDQIMGLYKKSDLAKKVMKTAEGQIRKSPTTGEFRLYSKRASFPTDKARELIGYEPVVDMARGIELSVQWLRHSGFLPVDPWTPEGEAGTA